MDRQTDGHADGNTSHLPRTKYLLLSAILLLSWFRSRVSPVISRKNSRLAARCSKATLCDVLATIASLPAARLFRAVWATLASLPGNLA